MVKNEKRKRSQEGVGEDGNASKKVKGTGAEAEVIAAEEDLDRDLDMAEAGHNEPEEVEDTVITIHLSNHSIPSLAEELGYDIPLSMSNLDS